MPSRRISTRSSTRAALKDISNTASSNLGSKRSTISKDDLSWIKKGVTEEQLSRLTLQQLRQWCRDNEIPSGGSKTKLIGLILERLETDLYPVEILKERCNEGTRECLVEYWGYGSTEWRRRSSLLSVDLAELDDAPSSLLYVRSRHEPGTKDQLRKKDQLPTRKNSTKIREIVEIDDRESSSDSEDDFFVFQSAVDDIGGLEFRDSDKLDVLSSEDEEADPALFTLEEIRGSNKEIDELLRKSMKIIDAQEEEIEQLKKKNETLRMEKEQQERQLLQHKSNAEKRRQSLLSQLDAKTESLEMMQEVVIRKVMSLTISFRSWRKLKCCRRICGTDWKLRNPNSGA